MPVVGVRTKNHRNDVRKRGAVDDDTDDRWTPAYIFDSLNAEHGFTLDVAAAAHNAKCERYFTREIDGLAQSWQGEVVWCNPPYSRIEPWVRKALEQVAIGCRKVVMLLPANRTEQTWWQTLIEPIRDCDLGISTRNLPGRARFGNVKHNNARGGSHSGYGCVVVVFEPVDPCSANPKADKSNA